VEHFICRPLVFLTFFFRRSFCGLLPSSLLIRFPSRYYFVFRQKTRAGDWFLSSSMVFSANLSAGVDSLFPPPPPRPNVAKCSLRLHFGASRTVSVFPAISVLPVLSQMSFVSRRALDIGARESYSSGQLSSPSSFSQRTSLGT